MKNDTRMFGTEEDPCQSMLEIGTQIGTRYDFNSGDMTKNSFINFGKKTSDKSKTEVKGQILLLRQYLKNSNHTVILIQWKV